MIADWGEKSQLQLVSLSSIYSPQDVAWAHNCSFHHEGYKQCRLVIVLYNKWNLNSHQTHITNESYWRHKFSFFFFLFEFHAPHRIKTEINKIVTTNASTTNIHCDRTDHRLRDTRSPVAPQNKNQMFLFLISFTTNTTWHRGRHKAVHKFPNSPNSVFAQTLWQRELADHTRCDVIKIIREIQKYLNFSVSFASPQSFRSWFLSFWFLSFWHISSAFISINVLCRWTIH